ncbi:MAG: nucleotidyltransferase family protein [Erysipelotrichaceae bacterium]|nr:nucleotidyltransferase family protein [Erysipelotrichaceae bacterium]
MKTCGIITEYNPFHNGHEYHIQKAREISGCDVLIAVMSGNFVQRGEPAIIDKWQRTKAAIENGVDLVLELPFAFVMNSATQFGENAVRILAQAKADSIVFGSETDNLEELKEIAEMSFNIDNFKENMKKGYSYPKSYGFMADSYGPNDILAISYLRALKDYPEITPYSILRSGNNYHDTDLLKDRLPSGAAIRQGLKENEDISAFTPMADQLMDYPSPKLSDYYPYIRTVLLTTPLQQLEQIFLMDEGIEHHLVKQAELYDDFSEFLDHCVTRRYTRSRIQRTLCQLMVHNTKADMAALPAYDKLRVLGFSDTGKEYLKFLQENEVRIANHFTGNIKPYRDLEYKAAVVYGMFMNKSDRYKVVRGEISGLNLKENEKSA